MERTQLEWKRHHDSMAAVVCADNVLLFEMVADLARAVSIASGEPTAAATRADSSAESRAKKPKRHKQEVSPRCV